MRQIIEADAVEHRGLQIARDERRNRACSSCPRICREISSRRHFPSSRRRRVTIEVLRRSWPHSACARRYDDAIVFCRAQDEQIAEVAYREFGHAAETARFSGHMTKGGRSVNELPRVVPRHAECIDDASMDSAPMPPTLETIASSLTE